MSIGFGYLARIGHLYPSGGLCDFEIQAMAPEGVQFVTTRLPFRDTSIESDRGLVADLEAHAKLLADAKVDLIAMNCTAAGVLAGPDSVNARIRQATGIPAVTTIQAVLAACDTLRATRIALMTAYRPEVVDAEIAFFKACGIEVVTHASQPCSTPYEQARLEPHTWTALATRLKGSFDAVLISCAGVRVSSEIAEIERATGKPVVTSNSSLLWFCLRTLGIQVRPTGYGALMGT